MSAVIAMSSLTPEASRCSKWLAPALEAESRLLEAVHTNAGVLGGDAGVD
jgi:hypothetical protein